MKIMKLLLIFSIIFHFNISAKANSPEFPPPSKSGKTNMAVSILTGYNNGLGLSTSFILSDFAQDFPLALRFGLNASYISNPGIALDARHIFINDNSNGTPEKQGRFYGFNLDFVYPMKKNLDFYFGIRKIRSVSNFNFIGGNEDFDIITNPWGVGLGTDANFPINSKMSLSFSVGSGYYFPTEMDGHGTIYSPDGQNVNSRKDYVYSDADNAVNQPKVELKAMLGLKFSLK